MPYKLCVAYMRRLAIYSAFITIIIKFLYIFHVAMNNGKSCIHGYGLILALADFLEKFPLSRHLDSF